MIHYTKYDNKIKKKKKSVLDIGRSVSRKAHIPQTHYLAFFFYILMFLMVDYTCTPTCPVSHDLFTTTSEKEQHNGWRREKKRNKTKQRTY